MDKLAVVDGIGRERIADEESFPTVFTRNVAAHPHKPAIIATTSAVTYAELNEQAEQIAAMLVDYAGFDAEPISLLFDQEIAAFAATIAVLKSGKFYVTLDPLHPPVRLAEILADSRATTLLTNDSCIDLARQICPASMQIINIDALPPHVAPILPISIPPNAYAYIGYTSGSTGKAKGVLETHQNHLCHWQNLMRAQPAYGSERVLFLNRLSFSGGQLAFYLTFLAGATLYLYDLQREGIARLPDWIQQHRITVWNSVPTVFRAFVAQITDPRQVASVRLLRLASDTILAQDLEAYRHLFAPTCQLWFCYALTEAKTVTMTFLDHSSIIEPTAIPSGQPIQGMEIHIVDEDGHRLGPNQVGEIVVRSRYVSPGYWDNSELTAARFHPDPDEVGVYLLQTGDLGMVDAQGCLYHKGRKDTQVKIRGYRVELGEIEAHLATLDGVQEVAVRLHSTADGHERLAAYLRCHSTPPPSSSQLRRMLQERLPTYMIPNSFTFLERMPVNRNGKIDRAALPLPAPERPALDTPLTVPRTPLETTLVTIWQEVLGVDPLGVHDHFFDVGGDSLLAVTLFDRIADTTGKTLPLSAILQAPTIAQQADLLQHADTRTSWSSLVAVRASGSRPPLFLVPPAYGTALNFIKLVRYLDPEQPLYAFDPVGLDGTEKPLQTVEAMAAHYITAMRACRPQGPYRLGGKCMGGHVAYEMARQLLAQGCEIEALVILDSSAPYNGPHWKWIPPQLTLEYYQRKMQHYGERLQERLATRTLDVTLRLRWQKVKKSFAPPHHLQILEQTHLAAQRSYVATPIPQQILLIQSEEYANKSKHQSRWSTLALNGLELKVVLGATHRNILAENEEHIRRLAHYLQEYLSQVDQQYAVKHR